jgi:hypothetical protein
MMFKLIRRVIARITQVMGGATLTQPAGRAPQVHTTQTGKAPSVSADTNLQSKPASKSPKRKPKAAQLITAAASRKAEQKPAQTTSGKRGRPRKTPV